MSTSSIETANEQSVDLSIQDDFYANYRIEEKTQNANDLVCVCLALSLLGMLVLGLTFQVLSMVLLGSTLFRYQKPSKLGMAIGMGVGLWNILFILSKTYLLLSQ